MNADTRVDQARQALGPVGAMLPVTFSNAVPVDTNAAEYVGTLICRWSRASRPIDPSATVS